MITTMSTTDHTHTHTTSHHEYSQANIAATKFGGVGGELSSLVRSLCGVDTDEQIKLMRLTNTQDGGRETMRKREMSPVRTIVTNVIQFSMSQIEMK